MKPDLDSRPFNAEPLAETISQSIPRWRALALRAWQWADRRGPLALAFLGALLFAFRGVTLKASGVDPASLLLWSSVVALAISGGVAMALGYGVIGVQCSRPQLAGRAAWGALNSAAIFCAVSLLSVSVAMTLVSSGPLLLAVFAPAFLGTRRSWGLLAIVAAGFSGLVFATLPSGGEATSWLGAAAGLAGGATAAVAQVYSNRIASGGTRASLTAVVWMSAAAIPVAVIWVLDSGPVEFDTPLMVWSTVIGLLSVAGQFLAIAAYRRGELVSVAAVALAVLPLTSVLEWLILGEVASSQETVGMLMTMGALFALWARRRVSGAPESPVKPNP